MSIGRPVRRFVTSLRVLDLEASCPSRVKRNTSEICIIHIRSAASVSPTPLVATGVRALRWGRENSRQTIFHWPRCSAHRLVDRRDMTRQLERDLGDQGGGDLAIDSFSIGAVVRKEP